MPTRLLGDPLNLMTNPTSNIVEGRFSRRTGLKGFAALMLGTYWFRRPIPAEARSAAPSSYCFQQCAQDVGEEYADTVNNCGSEGEAYAQVGCLLVSYLVQRSGLKKCGTFYCGDPKRYPPPKPPPPPPPVPPSPPPPTPPPGSGGVDFCANCQSVGGKCCGATLDPVTGNVNICACYNPTIPCPC